MSLKRDCFDHIIFKRGFFLFSMKLPRGCSNSILLCKINTFLQLHGILLVWLVNQKDMYEKNITNFQKISGFRGCIYKDYLLLYFFSCGHCSICRRQVEIEFGKNFKAKHTQRTQTSLRRLQDVLKRSRRLTTKPDVVKTSGKRRLIYDVLKTSYLRRLEDVQFTTS